MKKTFPFCCIGLLTLMLLTPLFSYAQTQAEIDAVAAQKKALTFPRLSLDRVIKDFTAASVTNVHPRFIASQADIDRMKQLIASGDPLMKRTWETMLGRANQSLTAPFVDGDLDAAQLRVHGTHDNAAVLPPLVFAYWITGETKYAQRAWEIFENMCTWRDWGIVLDPPYRNRHYLDTAIGAFDAALIYDGLYHFLTSAQRDFIWENVKKYVYDPTMGEYKMKPPRHWWWNTAYHNWNGVCNGGLILASLAFFERDPSTMGWYIAQAANGLPHYLREFEPDGQSDEGVGYWSYGLMYTLPALEAMQRQLGTTYGLGETPGLRKAGYFPLMITGPVATLNAGDDGLKRSRSQTYFWFAKHFNDPLIARLNHEIMMENNSSMGWFDMLCYDPAQVKDTSTKADMPLDNKVYGIELATLFEKRGDRNAFFVAMHGGNNLVNHGHLDAGSFYIQALGETWAYGNLGGDSYQYPGYFRQVEHYFEPDRPQEQPTRWDFYRMRAEGKNCLVFNPEIRQDQYQKGVSAFVNRGSTPQAGFFVLELQDCYQRDVDYYQRGMRLDRVNRIITIQDDFRAKSPSTVWWSMHTGATITISKDGRTAILEQNGKKLKAQIVGNEKAKFIELPATYLPGREFPHSVNGKNDRFRKLAVKQDGVTDMTFRVDFMPEDSKVQPATTQPISTWK